MRLFAHLALVASAVLSACVHPTNRGQDLAAAKDLFARNIDAIQRRDRDAYLSCYRQDHALLRNGPGGPVLGFDGLATSTSTAPASWPDSLAATDVQLHWLGPGYVYGSYRYRVVYSGATFEGISERVFVLRDGRWQIEVTTAFGAPASSDERLGAVAFLAGHWSMRDGERTTEETWSHARAGTMFGFSRTLVGNQTVSAEQLRIELRDGKLELIASPDGQALTRFALESHQTNEVVFANPLHDFPKRIAYRREGDALHAQASGDGRSLTWTYERR